MSRSNSSPMEQGELEASPDLQHSPRILVDLGESDPHADFLAVGSRSVEALTGGRDDASSPERHEDLDDVLIIQPPQVQIHSRKDKHRRRHKEGRKKGKDDRYVDTDVDQFSNRKSDRSIDKYDSKFSTKQSRRDEEREADEHRRKKSQLERERLERLEMERLRIERERDRKYREQQERAARDEQERRQTLRKEQEKRLAAREEQERRHAAREKERALQGKSRVQEDRLNERSSKNWKREDANSSNERSSRNWREEEANPLNERSSRNWREEEANPLNERSSRNWREEENNPSYERSSRNWREEETNPSNERSSRNWKEEEDNPLNERSSRNWRKEEAKRRIQDEETDNHSPEAKLRRFKNENVAETHSSHESVKSEHSASASPRGPEHVMSRASSQEFELNKSDAESNASEKSSNSSSSSSGNSSHHSSPISMVPVHHLRSKFDDTVADERSPLSRSSRSSSQSSRSDVDDDEDKHSSSIPSPTRMEPILPNYYPAYQGCRNVEEFHCLNRIEEGTYGVVYRARDLKTNEIVALKRLKMEKEKEGFPITSLREINTLLKSQHENIVTVREIVVGSNMDKIYIVMDYVEHDLKTLMEIMKEPFSVGEVKTLVRQLLRGVRHLHDNWIIHRDLKTSNLLFSHKGMLKIGDFGLAREYGSPLKTYTPIVVTLWYRSPELLLGTKLYSCPIDLWSVGCIFAELLTRKPLFPGKSEIDELNRIFKELGTPTEKIWPGVSELPAMKKCTFTEYPYNQLRQRFGSLLSDKGFELLNKFLTYNPDRRITAAEAVDHEYFNELPHPVDPSMFPTWPPKSEQSRTRNRGNSPKPPSGGKAYAKLLGDDDDLGIGFHLGAPVVGVSSAGPGFALKF